MSEPTESSLDPSLQDGSSGSGADLTGDPVTPGEKRQRNRQTLEAGKKRRQKKSKAPAGDDSTQASPLSIPGGGFGGGGSQSSAGVATESINSEQYRQLDNLVRWEAFLYASNESHHVIIKDIFGDDVQVYSDVYQQARTKIFNNIKSYKGQVLSYAMVCMPPTRSRLCFTN